MNDYEVAFRDVFHRFKVGLDDFGALGQAIFRRSLDLFWMRVTAINAPDTTAEAVVAILSQPGWFPKTCEIRVQEKSAESTLITIVDGADKRTLTVFRQPDRAKIPWRPKLKVYHIVQCSDASVEQASAHLSSEGARRVFVAGVSNAFEFDPDAPCERMLEQVCTRVLTSRLGDSFATIPSDALLRDRVERTVELLGKGHAATMHFSACKSHLLKGTVEAVLARDVCGASAIWLFEGSGRWSGTYEEQIDSSLDGFLGPGLDRAGQGGEHLGIYEATEPKDKLPLYGPSAGDLFGRGQNAAEYSELHGIELWEAYFRLPSAWTGEGWLEDIPYR